MEQIKDRQVCCKMLLKGGCYETSRLETNMLAERGRCIRMAICFAEWSATALQKTLVTPPILGDEKGDLLVIGWGSTKGAIEEAVTNLRAEGHKVSSLHLTFLQPMASGIREIMQRFKKVMTIEGNWSDDPNDEIIDETNRRYSALAMLLRSRYLVDVDCWSEVRGQPIKPNTIERVIREKLKQ